MSFFKYNIEDLIGSGARVLFADSTFTLPVTAGAPTLGIDDIITPTNAGNYAPKTGWTDLGSAREGQGSNYGRNITASEWRIEQATAMVAQDITDVPRTITAQIAEMNPANLQLFEDAPGTRAIAAAAGKPAQTAVDFGSIESLSHYTVAILGQFRKGVGKDVTELDGTIRGAFLAVCLFSATISPTNTTFELQKGQLANVSLEFTGFPHQSVTDGTRAVGAWIQETGPQTLS